MMTAAVLLGALAGAVSASADPARQLAPSRIPGLHNARATADGEFLFTAQPDERGYRAIAREWATADQVTYVVSLRENHPEERDADARARIERAFAEQGRRVVVRDLPIPDYRTPPSLEAFERMVDEVLAMKGRVVVHCQAGKGRTGMLQAAILHRRYGWPVGEAIRSAQDYGADPFFPAPSFSQRGMLWALAPPSPGQPGLAPTEVPREQLASWYRWRGLPAPRYEPNPHPEERRWRP